MNMNLILAVALSSMLAACSGSPNATCGIMGVGAFITDERGCALLGGTYFGDAYAEFPDAKDKPKAAPRRPCREYQSTIIVGGKPQETWGQACPAPDGSWVVMHGE